MIETPAMAQVIEFPAQGDLNLPFQCTARLIERFHSLPSCQDAHGSCRLDACDSRGLSVEEEACYKEKAYFSCWGSEEVSKEKSRVKGVTGHVCRIGPERGQWFLTSQCPVNVLCPFQSHRVQLFS